MNKFWTYFKIEGALALRCIDIVFFGVIMPVGIAALIAAIGGSGSTSAGYTYLQGTFGSLITVGICATAFMGIPLTLSDYRDKKVLKQFFVTPARPGLLLGVQGLVQAMFAIVSALLVVLLLTLVWGYRMPGSPLMVVLSFFLTMAAMYSLGMLMASLCRTVKTTNLVCTLVYFPMLFLSGATIPFEVFPGWLQAIAGVLPLTQGIKLIKGYSLSAQPEGALFSAAVLGVLAILGILISIKTFKWE